jgi:hypothetical protein
MRKVKRCLSVMGIIHRFISQMHPTPTFISGKLSMTSLKTALKIGILIQQIERYYEDSIALFGECEASVDGWERRVLQ